MLKIQQIIMSKKFLPVLLVLTIASLFIAFQTQGHGEDNPKTKNEKILRNVGLLLEQGHYSPKNINDSFSVEVLQRFVKDLDGDKSIFLQADIDSFAKYNKRIDDEIHGAKLESFYFITDSYTRRLNQTSQYFTEILSKPFDFTKEETIILDREKLPYAATEAAKKEVWRKRLKYLVLVKYSDLLEDREQGKNKKGAATGTDSGGIAAKKFVYKADSTLEREAREHVKKQIDRYFTTLKAHNTNDELFSSFVNAVTGEMDPHSSYFAPIDTRGFNEMMSGKFYGIGAQLKEEESKIKIASLITGMPAWKSGELGVNDEVIKIGQGSAEPVDVTGYAVTDAVKLIRGAEAGTEVRLTVRKPDGSIKVVILQRGEIKLEDTFAKSAVINNGSHKLGYIYLPEFYMDFERPNGAKCSEDVAKEIVKLKAENVEGIIMDLRGNGGGSLPEVVKMVGLFIEDGPICQVRGRDEKQPYLWKDRDKSVLYTGPLTVMVDEGSASASEIFAAAIQDYHRGIIIGSSSYGKGTVQRTIPLNPEAENPAFAKNSDDLGTVKLTLQKFYRINGGATQLKGVTPDIQVPDRYEFYKSREKDNDAALNWDEINKADYKPWVNNYSSTEVINLANAQVNASSTFRTMREQVEWIDKMNDKESSLNLPKYKEEQKELKLAYKRLDSLYKLPTGLVVTNNSKDTEGMSGDKEGVDRNKQFLNRVKGDIYVDETVKVMDNMIDESNVAVNAAAAAAAKKN
jgi:carboxyl-terminal processing protease